MLSFRRLLSILAITIFVSVLLISYSVNSERIDNIEITNVPPAAAERIENTQSKDSPYRFVLIGDEKDIKKTVEQALSGIKADVVEMNSLDNLSTTRDVVVFCQSEIGKCADLRQVDSFIKSGGKAIFAAGLDETHGDSYLYSMLGIVEKSLRIASMDFIVESGFLPFGDGEVTAPDFNASAFLKINNDSKVYVSDSKKGFPIVYTREFSQGKIAVINATMLEYTINGGLFVATVSALLDDFIYPVLGSNSVFLDNFPIATNKNDSESMRLYGRGTESFVIDRVWPTFQGVAVRNDLRYTSSVLTVKTTLDPVQDIPSNLFHVIGKSAMQFDGEIAFAGSFSGKGEIKFNHKFVKEFQDIFKNYSVNSFVIQDGYPSKDALAKICSTYDTVTIIRGYSGNGELGEEGYYKFLDENTYILPVYSQGMDYDNSKWRIMMSVAEKGLLSHCFDVNTIMGLSKDTPTWEENIEQLGMYEAQVFQKLKWLESKTLSDQVPVIDAYTNLDYGWDINDTQLDISGKVLYKNQAFLLRSEKEIKSSVGCEYQKISDNYYIIKVQDTTPVVYFNSVS